MDYESVSGIALVAMLGIAMVGWLPRRTVDSMKRVIEHREDRFSSSLHLVDENTGTRFSDVRGHEGEGAAMQHTQSRDSGMAVQHVVRIRRMRRDAARRRRIIVVSLIALAVVVAVAAVLTPFSLWFVLIPCAMLVIVLALGVRASRHARRWEARVAARTRTQHHPNTGRREATEASAREVERRRRAALAGGRPTDADSTEASSAGAAAADEARHRGVKHDGASVHRADGVDAAREPVRDEVPTSVMEQREIRRALRQARDHRSAATAAAAQAVAGSESPESATVAAQACKAAAGVVGTPQSKPISEQGVSARFLPHTVAVQPPAELVVEGPVAANEGEVADATDELGAVHPARALNAFDMAAQQDLISFSLGSARDDAPAPSAEPESLEIKSTKQVATAHAVDVDPASAQPQAADRSKADHAQADRPAAAASAHAASTDAASSADQGPSSAAASSRSSARTPAKAAPLNSRAFHQGEVESAVDVPQATSDSLGADLEAVLARRAS
ncbi:MAG: hypothetical protein SOI13_00530 [Bifidobacterium mongoliense]|jgi:hypothetical protein|uniref:hypothetical protein n=1 Tax=Bifidobacterium mongoliense TaxID=518643 RepID=UPI002F35D029